MTSAGRAGLMLGVVLGVCGSVGAQSQPSADALVAHGLAIGQRSEGVRQKLAVAPVVVVVRDAASYVEAISRWRLSVRFPVLIDDGTPVAREHIARFVRGFGPERVVRWSAGGGAMKDWVADRALIDRAIGRAWTVDGKEPEKGFDASSIMAGWKAIDLTPPGVVVMSERDPAWTAGVALAAGRGQPILWIESSRRLDAAMTPEQADALDLRIRDLCASLGLSCEKQGDAIEAVTICAAVEQTVKGTSVGVVATTDRIGRLTGGRADVARWAWCGQIFGSASEAAYRAMCALFLPRGESAWVFDSYPGTGEWGKYDGTAAGAVLEKWGVRPTVFDGPRSDLAAWRNAVESAIGAGVVMVNTKGNKEFFELSSGTGLLGDVPILSRPAAVHFIHSWSAQFVGTRNTLAGRWLDRGAYVYYGSVEEPTLTAFMPTPIVAARLASGMPFGAAVRYDASPAWKLTVIGDPLATFGARAPRAEMVALEGAEDVGEAARAVVKEKPAEAIALFVMVGRDADAARLGSALLSQKKLDEVGMLAAGPAMFRAGRSDDVLGLLRDMPPAAADRLPELRDMMWLAAWGRLGEMTDRVMLENLARHVRPEQLERDMGEVGEALRKVAGGAAATAALERARDEMTDPGRKSEADRIIQRLKGRWR